MKKKFKIKKLIKKLKNIKNLLKIILIMLVKILLMKQDLFIIIIKKKKRNLWNSIKEEIKELKEEGIDTEIIPG
jgi:precorrin-4 methylase